MCQLIVQADTALTASERNLYSIDPAQSLQGAGADGRNCHFTPLSNQKMSKNDLISNLGTVLPCKKVEILMIKIGFGTFFVV